MLTRKEVFAYSHTSCPKERLLSRYKVSSNGCWEYTMGLDRCGYGRFSIGPRRLGAHKVSYVLHHGDVPHGKVVMHSCDNPKCINPKHLSIGSVSDNVHDCIRKGRFSFAYESKGGTLANRSKIIIARNDDEMHVFTDIRAAEKHGFSNAPIYRCINGKLKTYKGYVWEGLPRNQHPPAAGR